MRLEQGHVVALTDPRGAVHLPEDTARARFDLVSPAAALAADRARDRSDAVSAFDAAPDADSVADTRPNMLGREVLDAVSHPRVGLSSVAVGDGCPCSIRRWR